MRWTMPLESGRHERLWMAFPRDGATLGDDPADAEAARRTWAAVANAAAGFEPVTMVVDPSAVAAAARFLSGDIELVEAPLDDFWMRDIGPTFVIGDDGALGAVDWTFNGWGATGWSTWERDAEIGATVGRVAGAEVLPSMMVNEGGGILADGAGTVVVTETVQLDPRRNPYLTRARVETELRRTIGTTTVVWLPRGLTRDYESGGTRGHVDMVAAFVRPGRLLLHDQPDAGHPDHAVVQQLRPVLEQAVDAAGNAIEIVPLPAPATMRDAGGFVDWNYANHVVVNGGVIVPSFGDPVADDRAAGILADEYGRTAVQVEARAVFARGGGLHCITQNQPASAVRPPSP